ncbi:hypothetical protein [Thalassomonas actiniarum]|uniref:Uncharacterized protein n=1 Tax=Thalassomonas actiniarum TaxID=485447 RepID=A0AAE9YV31_9GAMM|nr:hypothetical protein [Thalassomonas actiniarum]WDE00894.1 hypothetical protein SG35_009835 [Thalassomonas actiniarum]
MDQQVNNMLITAKINLLKKLTKVAKFHPVANPASISGSDKIMAPEGAII